MAQIPLNKFLNRNLLVPDYGGSVQTFYVCPSQRATIILNIQCANITNSPTTITVGISSANTLFYLVSGFTIPKNDAANISLGKILLTPNDGIFSYASSASGISMSVAMLESFND